MSRTAAAIEISSLSKTFPGQRALADVSLRVESGEVHCLLGENGSGKSTLIKVLSGFHTPDTDATITVNDLPLSFGSVASSSELGLRFVHQNLGIISQMTAVENLSLATTRHSWWRRVRKRAEVERTRTLFDRFGVDSPMKVPLGRCRAVDRTIVAIVRALDTLGDSGVLVLDEPTAALPPDEVAHLFDTIRELRSRGIATVYVSHRLDEVFAIADRISVLRDGRMQGTHPVGELSRKDLVRLIVGAAVEGEHGASARRGPVPTAPRLVVTGLTSRTIAGIDLTVAAGEIVGIAGLTGSGRDEFASAIVGANASRVDSMRVDDTPLELPVSPRRALGHGIALVPGNRGAGSAIGAFDIRENVTLPSLDTVSTSGRVLRSREVAVTRHWIDQLDIRPQDPFRRFRQLSGGNQQKTILAKWFNIAPKAIVLDDPTSGVDVGARQAIYDLIRAKASEGTSVIVSSSDHEDLLSICDRVVVLHEGRIAAELTGEQINSADLLLAQSRPADLEEQSA